MFQMKKILLTVTVTALISACGVTGNSGMREMTITKDSQGRPMTQTVQVTSKDAAKIVMGQEAEASRQQYFAMKSVQYQNTSPENMAMTRAVELLGNDRAPRGFYDYQIAYDAQVTSRWQLGVQAATQWIPFLSLYKSRGSGGTTYNTTVDNGSEYRGCQGDDCNTEYNESVGGIPLLPGTTQPLGFNSALPEEELVDENGNPIELDDEGNPIDDCPEGFTRNEFGDCSDGMGGTPES